MLCKALAIVPDLSIRLYPIRSFAVVTTPMSIKLLQPKHEDSEGNFQTGFLTLDQERRIVPLNANDPQVKVYTLVGIWVSDIPQLDEESEEQPLRTDIPLSKMQKVAEKEDEKARQLHHPLVFAAILRFLFCEEIKMRMSPRLKDCSSATFLLINFSKGGALPQFLEFQLKGGKNSWMLIESSYTIPREPKSSFQPIQYLLSICKSAASELDSVSICRLAYIISLVQDASNQKAGVRKPDQETHVRRSRNPILKQGILSDNTKKDPGLNGTKAIPQKSNGEVKTIKICSAIRSSAKVGVAIKPESVHPIGNWPKRSILNALPKKKIKDEQPLLQREEQKEKHFPVVESSGAAEMAYMQMGSTMNAPREDSFPQQTVPTPSQSSSLNSSINSAGFCSGKLAGRFQSRISGISSADKESTAMGDLPSYSGNASLIKTPDYLAMHSSSGKETPTLEQIVLNQQKQIQDMHQYMIYLSEELKLAKQNQSTHHISIPSYSSAGHNTGTMSLSSDCNMEYRPNFNSFSNSQGSYPSTLHGDNSSTYNILNSLRNMMSQDRDSGLESHKASTDVLPSEDRPSTAGARLIASPKSRDIGGSEGKSIPPSSGKSVLSSMEILSVEKMSKLDSSRKSCVVDSIIKKSGETRMLLMHQQDFEVPRIIEPNLSKKPKQPESKPPEEKDQHSGGEALSAIKETNESICTPEQDGRHKYPETSRCAPQAKRNPPAKSDWTMHIPHIIYNPDSDLSSEMLYSAS